MVNYWLTHPICAVHTVGVDGRESSVVATATGATSNGPTMGVAAVVTRCCDSWLWTQYAVGGTHYRDQSGAVAHALGGVTDRREFHTIRPAPIRLCM